MLDGERLAAAEQLIATTIKEVDKVRDNVHNIANIVHGHSGVINVFSEEIPKLVSSIEKSAKTTDRMMYVFVGASAVATIMAGALFNLLKIAISLYQGG